MAEDQKNSIDLVVKCAIDLLSVLAESNKKNEEDAEEGVRTPRSDNLNLDDDDFMVGLVQDIPSNDGNQKVDIAMPHFSVSDREIEKEVNPSGSSLIVTAKDTADPPKDTQWGEEREKLMNRITELEKNMEVSEASDARWYAEYQEVKERIRFIAQKWAGEDAEGTIDEIERVIESMAEEIETMRKTSEGDIYNNNSTLLTKEAKIEELTAVISKLEENLLMARESKDKDVFFFCKQIDGGVEQQLFY